MTVTDVDGCHCDRVALAAEHCDLERPTWTMTQAAGPSASGNSEKFEYGTNIYLVYTRNILSLFIHLVYTWYTTQLCFLENNYGFSMSNSYMPSINNSKVQHLLLMIGVTSLYRSHPMGPDHF